MNEPRGARWSLPDWQARADDPFEDADAHLRAPAAAAGGDVRSLIESTRPKQTVVTAVDPVQVAASAALASLAHELDEIGGEQTVDPRPIDDLEAKLSELERLLVQTGSIIPHDRRLASSVDTALVWIWSVTDPTHATMVTSRDLEAIKDHFRRYHAPAPTRGLPGRLSRVWGEFRIETGYRPPHLDAIGANVPVDKDFPWELHRHPGATLHPLRREAIRLLRMARIEQYAARTVSELEASLTRALDALELCLQFERETGARIPEHYEIAEHIAHLHTTGRLGNGVDEGTLQPGADWRKAAHWYRLAAEGDYGASARLATLYEERVKGKDAPSD